VALTDGVFTVELGPTGAATDTPDDPLTTDLVTALSGDVSGTSPVRFLEVTVGATGALTRSQLLTVPYALRAESAAAADTATTAIDATNVGGLSSTFVTQIYAYTNLDDSGPGNDDPQEGLGDVDGDGIANFLDPDNDDDGLTDSEEVAQGTDLNLVTPIISGFSPPIPPDGVPFSLTVLGANFDPGQLVTLGGAPLPAQNLTAASFDLSVSAQPPSNPLVTVILPNGETATASLMIGPVYPTIASLSPSGAPFFATTTVHVTGTDFRAGLVVDFGSESPTPLNLTPNGFDVVVGPQAAGTASVVVTDVSGPQATGPGFTFENEFPHGASFDADTQFGFDVNGLSQTLVDGKQRYELDTDADATPDASFVFQSQNGNGQGIVAFDPTGTLRGLRCRTTGTDVCDVEVSADLDADGDLEDESGVVLETLDANSAIRLLAAELDFDSTGAVAGAYTRSDAGFDVVAFHDRDGDGLFSGPNEHVVVEPFVSIAWRLDMAVDASDRVAVAYYDQLEDEVNVAWDRSGDGDFDDTVGSTPEIATALSGIPVVDCLGLDFAPDGDLVVVYASASSGTVLARDLDGDGDFDQPGETLTLSVSSSSACDVDGEGTLAVVHAVGALHLLVDRNDDGDFGDADEDVVLSNAIGMNRARIVHASDGRAWVATSPNDDTIYADPTP
jgi:hypothetical protein